VKNLSKNRILHLRPGYNIRARGVLGSLNCIMRMFFVSYTGYSK